MMQAQLNKFKEAALEVQSLSAEIHTLAGILERKVWLHLTRILHSDLTLCVVQRKGEY